MRQLMIGIRKIGNKCVRHLCRLEYVRLVFQGFHERPIELRFEFQRVYIWQVGHFTILMTAAQHT